MSVSGSTLMKKMAPSRCPWPESMLDGLGLKLYQAWSSVQCWQTNKDCLCCVVWYIYFSYGNSVYDLWLKWNLIDCKMICKIYLRNCVVVQQKILPCFVSIVIIDCCWIVFFFLFNLLEQFVMCLIEVEHIHTFRLSYWLQNERYLKIIP